MAAGLPVVGWRAGNLPHLIDDGVEGFAVPPGDVDALSAALRRLADDAELRSRMGVAARRRAESLPTWEQSAALLIGGIRAVLAGAPPPSAARR
jgi:glycosyltransferase involved in cell wall biosynthesis